MIYIRSRFTFLTKHRINIERVGKEGEEKNLSITLRDFCNKALTQDDRNGERKRQTH